MANEETIVEETGQTGQELPAGKPLGETEEKDEKHGKKHPWIEIALSESENKWYWCLWSANGRKQAVSAEGYERRKDCLASIRTARKTLQEAKHVAQA